MSTSVEVLERILGSVADELTSRSCAEPIRSGPAIIPILRHVC